MSAARRSLLTATAAGTLLAALWFVPSADATPDLASAAARQVPTAGPADAAPAVTGTDSAATADGTGSSDGTGLADTGSIDTTPYLVGGTLFLGLGAGFVAYAARRERTAAY
ncbi:hypothetical protein ACWCP6_04990 [Streptomyces sp. NPDC002004]